MAAHNLLSQVIVSVAAAICVAIISNNYFERPTPSAPVEKQAVETAVQAAPAIAAVPLPPEPEKPARLPKSRPAAKTVVRPASPKPQRAVIADLPDPAPALSLPASHATEIFVQPTHADPALIPGEPAERRLRLLGAPLPGFVPRLDDMARSVVGRAREGVVGIIEEVRD